MSGAEPVESPEVSVSAPEADRWQPVEQPTPPAEPEPEERPGRQPVEVGTPAGQMAVGVASVLTLGGVGLYQVAGVVGLAATGAAGVAGAGSYGYWRWRRAHPRRGGRVERTSRSAGHRSARSFDLGKSRGGVGRRMRFGAPSGSGRSVRSRMPASILGRAGGRAAGRRVPLGDAVPARRGAFRPAWAGRKTGSAHPRPTRRATAQTAVHAVSTPLRAAGRAGRMAGHRVVQAGRAARAYAAPRLARVRAASRLLDERTGHLASRGRRRARHGAAAVAQQVRRAAGWADRRTGQRASIAWAAALAGGRRAAVQALVARWRRWDAHAVAALVAVAAWVSAPVRRRVAARKAAETSSAASPTPTASTELAPAGPAISGGRPSLRLIVTPQNRGTMNALINHAVEMPTVASAYESEDMMVVKTDLELLREVPLQVAAAIRIWTEKLAADYPLHPDVVEQMMGLYEGFCALANDADEVSNTFQKAHERDIARRLEPRTGEQKWNAR